MLVAVKIVNSRIRSIYGNKDKLWMFCFLSEPMIKYIEGLTALNWCSN